MLQPYGRSTLTLVWIGDRTVMKNGQMHMYSVTNSEMETQQSDEFLGINQLNLGWISEQ